ncbi:MAG: hypothetical protein HOI66_22355 [Verrucomicrobia bacterium]|nr:hypothetical protein [Verrucomicrobiota bacterium]
MKQGGPYCRVKRRLGMDGRNTQQECGAALALPRANRPQQKKSTHWHLPTQVRNRHNRHNTLHGSNSLNQNGFQWSIRAHAHENPSMGYPLRKSLQSQSQWQDAHPLPHTKVSMARRTKQTAEKPDTAIL